MFSAVSSLSPVSIHTLMSSKKQPTGFEEISDSLRHLVLESVLHSSASNQDKFFLDVLCDLS